MVKVGLIGEPHTGKGTMAETLAHMIHTLSVERGYVPWAFRRFGKEEFYNLSDTIKDLPPANYILHFYDLSFLEQNKKLNMVKQAVAEIRHLREDIDIKVILIYDYHYTKGLDKYLRQSHFKYFLWLGSSEKENMAEIVGKKDMGKVMQFTRLCVEQGAKKTATFRLLKKAPAFKYSYKNPFIVALFWNNYSLRFVISPPRTWLTKHCTICSEALHTISNTTMSTEDFIQLGTALWNNGLAIGWRLEQNRIGINLYKDHITETQYWIQKVVKMHNIDRAAVTKALGLIPRQLTTTPKAGILEITDPKAAPYLARLKKRLNGKEPVTNTNE